MKLVPLALCSALLIPACHAELVVIVNNANNETISGTTVTNIMLGKTKAFPSGAKAIPVILDYEAPDLDGFLNKSVGKSAAQFRAYWSKAVFAGIGTPPQTFKTSQDVVDLVARNPDVIGIADSAAAKGKVKVIAMP